MAGQAQTVVSHAVWVAAGAKPGWSDLWTKGTPRTSPNTGSALWDSSLFDRVTSPVAAVVRYVMNPGFKTYRQLFEEERLFQLQALPPLEFESSQVSPLCGVIG